MYRTYRYVYCVRPSPAAGGCARAFTSGPGYAATLLYYIICRARGCVVSHSQSHAGRTLGSMRRRAEKGWRRLPTRFPPLRMYNTHSVRTPGQQHPRKHVTSMTSAVPVLTSLLTSIRSRATRLVLAAFPP